MRWPLLGLVMAFPSLIATSYFVVLSADHTSAPNPRMQAVYIGGKVVQFLLPVAGLWLMPPPNRPYILSYRRSLLYGLAFGLLVAAAIIGCYRQLLRHQPVFDGVSRILRSKVDQLGAGEPGRFLALALFLTLIHSALEEYYWRWFVFGWLERVVPFAVAVVLGGVAFMAHHLIILYVYFPGRVLVLVVPLSLGVAVGGGVWSLIYRRTGSLLGPWVSHALIDAAVMVVGYDVLSG